MKAVLKHIEVLAKAREKGKVTGTPAHVVMMQPGSTPALCVQLLQLMCVCAVKGTDGLQQAALDEYGAELHIALRSRRDELLYLRKLTEMLFPFVMPPKATDCR